jgi:hypothetical protein
VYLVGAAYKQQYQQQQQRQHQQQQERQQRQRQSSSSSTRPRSLFDLPSSRSSIDVSAAAGSNGSSTTSPAAAAVAAAAAAVAESTGGGSSSRRQQGSQQVSYSVEESIEELGRLADTAGLQVCFSRTFCMLDVLPVCILPLACVFAHLGNFHHIPTFNKQRKGCSRFSHPSLAWVPTCHSSTGSSMRAELWLLRAYMHPCVVFSESWMHACSITWCCMCLQTLLTAGCWQYISSPGVPKPRNLHWQRQGGGGGCSCSGGKGKGRLAATLCCAVLCCAVLLLCSAAPCCKGVYCWHVPQRCWCCFYWGLFCC